MRLDPENKKPFIENRFKSVLQSHGNSLVVVHDDDIVKVHVHTLHPGAVLTYGQSFGEFIKIKVENMTEQHTSLQEKKAGEEKPAENPEPVEEKFEPTNDVGLVAVAAGKGIADAFLELGVNEIITGGQTMNPSIVDIVNAIKKAGYEVQLENYVQAVTQYPMFKFILNTIIYSLASTILMVIVCILAAFAFPFIHIIISTVIRIIIKTIKSVAWEKIWTIK